MSVPIRRPDVNVLYPTRAAYEEAFATPPAPVGPRVAAPTPSPAAAFAFDELLNLQHLQASGLPQGLSWREQSVETLIAAGTRIVSEHEGLIRKLLITVPKFEDDAQPGAVVDPRLARHFIRLLTVYRHADLVIVAAPSQRIEIDRWIAQAGGTGRVDFISSPRFRFSVWAQDAYVALHDRFDHEILCEGVCFPRFDDMTVADDVAMQSSIIAMQSPLFFQGGNVLGGSSRTLIGLDYVAKNTTRFKLPDEPAVLSAFGALFGTPKIIKLGGGKSGNYDMMKLGILSGGQQPIFHIDMYVTPTGVLGKTGKEIVFLGRPAKARDVVGRFSDVLHLDSPVYDGFFQETFQQLSDEGFEVRTLPLWITYGNLRDPRKRLKYYNLTWNNALVEKDETTSRVLLPHFADQDDAKQFGVDWHLRHDLQQAAIDEWQAIGYTVELTDGMEDLVWGDGAVHCMTKTLRRA